MSRKRQLEYQVRILEQCKEGQTKLQIMAQTRYSHQQFIKYSTKLHAHGYLRMQGDQYVTTLRGLDFLRRYKVGEVW